METVAEGSAKRRKVVPPPASAAGGLVGILCEPHLLSHVAAFLPKPSRALLAVALNAPSSSPMWDDAAGLEGRLSAGSRAVLSTDDWEELDFCAVDERTLQTNLTDDELRATLACIDAPNKLRKLMMHYCGKTFSGHGLDILRGSLVIEQISLVEMKRAGVGFEP